MLGGLTNQRGIDVHQFWMIFEFRLFSYLKQPRDLYAVKMSLRALRMLKGVKSYKYLSELWTFLALGQQNTPSLC